MTQNKVATLESRAEQLKAQYEAAAARLKEEKRRHDTRCKILWGAAVLKAAEKNPDALQKIQTLLARELNEKDRKFVGFDDTPKMAEQDNGNV